MPNDLDGWTVRESVDCAEALDPLHSATWLAMRSSPKRRNGCDTDNDAPEIRVDQMQEGHTLLSAAIIRP